MKNELINKLLQEQTTPEEEHLIAQMLRQKEQEDIDLWMVEDETETYNRLVKKRHIRRRQLRWAAAIFVGILAVGAIVLWQHSEKSVDHNPIAARETKAAPTTTPEPVVEKNPDVLIVAKNVTKKPVKARLTHKTTNTVDSLQYYIARLEKELAEVPDSNYTTKAEQIIRADARLQRLVQRIMIGEMEKDNPSVEAMLNNEMTEEQP